jgi:glutamate racemase
MIGIFDSGSGGLSVLRALRARAPEADVVYFGDLKNAPYGNKSREELGALTVLGIQKLIDEGATEIVSACNSVSVSIVLPMFEILDLPHANIIEMVGPTVSAFKGVDARVLVLATAATIESHVYQDGFRVLGVEADGVAVPELVSLIEAGAVSEKLYSTIDRTIRSAWNTEYTHLVLGCTHFPLVRDVFEEVVHDIAPNVAIVDPADAVVKSVVSRFDTTGKGSTRFLLSKESDVFRSLSAPLCEERDCTFEQV